MSASSGIRLLGKIHGKVVFERRVAVLAENLAAMLSPGTRLLDVGCGDGRLAALLRDSVPGLEVEGVEVRPRDACAIPCRLFDGSHLPFPDGSIDCCLLVDVLHHMENPLPLLRDACRVSRQFVLVKDHLAENALDHWTLRLMDWVGNRPHGVTLPYAYLSASQWQTLYQQLALSVERTTSDLPLYSAPFSLVFGRNLHFISLLKKRAEVSQTKRHC
jgi:ubiquinone/menaquinone biosynthesis C-methylase UbiE